mmetsp:Transcript_92046/g.281731  ORF Transcript_92046/g.281731 Transcript_92046/m.281731 type:complete len:102 (-) Transcript_92046:285-590(-)
MTEVLDVDVSVELVVVADTVELVEVVERVVVVSVVVELSVVVLLPVVVVVLVTEQNPQVLSQSPAYGQDPQNNSPQRFCESQFSQYLFVSSHHASLRPFTL